MFRVFGYLQSAQCVRVERFNLPEFNINVNLARIEETFRFFAISVTDSFSCDIYNR